MCDVMELRRVLATTITNMILKQDVVAFGQTAPSLGTLARFSIIESIIDDTNKHAEWRCWTGEHTQRMSRLPVVSSEYPWQLINSVFGCL